MTNKVIKSKASEDGSQCYLLVKRGDKYIISKILYQKNVVKDRATFAEELEVFNNEKEAKELFNQLK
jgi:hypothetical protein